MSLNPAHFPASVIGYSNEDSSAVSVPPIKNWRNGTRVMMFIMRLHVYVEQLEYLGYVLQKEISVGLILNSLTSDFVGFVRNYNKHNLGKTIGELLALLIEYEKGLPKKATTPQVLAIQGAINPKPPAKEHPVKDDACHHCKEAGHWKRNSPVYLAELMKKNKNVSTTSTSAIRAKLNLDSTYLWHCRLAHISKKRIEKLQHGRLLKPTDYESSDQCVSFLSGYTKETMGYYFYFPPENKIVLARYVEFLEKNLISQETSGRAVELEEIQDEDILRDLAILIHHFYIYEDLSQQDKRLGIFINNIILSDLDVLD
ncbi:retrotransposon protein, putative, ty1-copia subclass [Tanacetum coccineum]